MYSNTNLEELYVGYIPRMRNMIFDLTQFIHMGQLIEDSVSNELLCVPGNGFVCLTTDWKLETPMHREKNY